MRKFMGTLLALGLLLTHTLSSFSDDKDGLVENPKYKFWASFKPGATATYHEVTKHSGADKDSFPDGNEEKTVVYKLVSVNDKQVVVSITVVEKEFLGTLETAPTKATYPAKVKATHLHAVLDEFGAKKGAEATVKVGATEIKCQTLVGSQKKDTTTIDYQLHYSETVPGGIVKRARVAKDGAKVVAETTVTLSSYSQPKAAEKTKDKK